LHHAATTETYVLSRYDDVSWALADTDLFGSDVMRGVLMGQPTGVGQERLPREAATGWADATTRAMSGSGRGAFDDDALNAVLAMADHLGTEIDERQRAPRDDLLTTLVRAHGDDVLTREEAVGFAALLLFAGTETTTNLIGNACWALLANPDERWAFVADPTRLPAVLEETLRWESPVQYVFRRTTRPFERHGVEVPTDATVTLVLGAANRDPRHFGEDADQFRPDRSVGGHVGFGFGVHFCLGASLARQEATAALEALLPWLDVDQDLPVAGADDFIDSCQFRGRRRLELARKEA